MEFKQFVFIIWQRKNIFFFILFSVIILALFWFLVQPERYNISFSIDISRDGYQKTKDYRYDQLYRLQADEIFSETIVQWLEDPNLIRGIQRDHQENVFSIEDLRAEKLSSGYIRVFLKTKNEEDSSLIVSSIGRALNKRNIKINNEAGDSTWFSLVIGDPVVSKQQFNLRLILLGSILIGSILGAFASLLHYYWQSDENRN